MPENIQAIVDNRKRRWERFFDMGRPPSHRFIIRLTENVPQRPPPHFNKIQARIDFSWNKYCRQMDQASWLDDDSIPHIDPYTGTEIFAEAFGCPVHTPDGRNPFALPMIHQASEVSRVKVPDWDVPCLKILFDIADELRRRAGAAAVVKMVDIQSPMGIAALIWEKADFYAALIETPEAVHELAAKIRSLLTSFLDEWFARYGRGFVAHYPDYYFPRGITLSEDEIGVVSTEMFANFFLPELTRLSNRYGALGIHCCANAKHQWPQLRGIPGLKLLNVAQPPPIVMEAYRYFGAQIAQMHSYCSSSWSGDGPPEAWIKALPPGSRVVLQFDAATREEASALSEKLRALL